MKIGILGGTFNPIHLGHLVLAEQVREELSLEKVIFIPSNFPPHKENGDIVASQDRFKMLEIAIKGNKYFDISDLEIRRKGKSYSVDTLKALKSKFSADDLYFITGSDVLNYLNDWKDINEIFSLAKFVVATRPGYALDNLPSSVIAIPIKAVDISAYQIRQYIKNGRSIKYLVPEGVIEYIYEKGLYR